MTSTYFNQVYPTYIENWKGDLYSLSIPQIDIPLSLQDTIDLASNIAIFGVSFGSRQPIISIKERIDKALKHFPEGAFIRLGSRSAKDSRYVQYYGLKVTNSHIAIKILTDASERIAFDLRLALSNKYLPHIFIRQWFDLPSWMEFRCFMKSRRLVGISQYDCINLGHCKKIQKYAKKIKYTIEKFFERFKVASHLDDVVFDIFIIKYLKNNKVNFEVKLLELNPFFDKTGSCLFDWHRSNSFDGSFRFL